MFKRWLLGTHQVGIAWQRLDHYRDEFTFRFNHRHSRYKRQTRRGNRGTERDTALQVL